MYEEQIIFYLNYKEKNIRCIIYISIPIENYVIAESLLKIRLFNYRLENNKIHKRCNNIRANSELELTYNQELIKYKAQDKHLIRKISCGNKNYYRNNLLIL